MIAPRAADHVRVVAGHGVDPVADLRRDPGEVFACGQRPAHVGVTPGVEGQRPDAAELRADAQAVPGRVQGVVVPRLAAAVAEHEVLARRPDLAGDLAQPRGQVRCEVHGSGTVRLGRLQALPATTAPAPSDLGFGQVHLGPAQRQELALARPALLRGQHDRMEPRPRGGQLEQHRDLAACPGFAGALHRAPGGGALHGQLADALERRAVQVALAERPAERAAQERSGVVDGVLPEAGVGHRPAEALHLFLREPAQIVSREVRQQAEQQRLVRLAGRVGEAGPGGLPPDLEQRLAAERPMRIELGLPVARLDAVGIELLGDPLAALPVRVGRTQRPHLAARGPARVAVHEVPLPAVRDPFDLGDHRRPSVPYGNKPSTTRQRDPESVSGRRGSNPRPQAWEARPRIGAISARGQAIPESALPHFRTEENAMRPIRILSHAALALVLFIGGVAQAAPFLPDDGGWAGDIPASVCDGVQDAGPAIQAAIRSDPSPLGIHSVRLPIGDCRISQQLISRLADGTWLANVQLYGRGAGLTTIRLMDGAVGFDNALIPKAMIYTASQVCPSCGEGAEAPTTGSWNQAFQNRIADLTIDCGANPGCIGLDFAANNAGASLRHVDFRGPGPVGISMLRKYPGPLVIEDVHIHNFAVGIDVDETEYGVTLNDVEIDGYTLAKVRNGGNSVAIRRLFGCGPQPSVLNTDPKGLITLLESPGEQISGPGKFWRRDAGGESSSFVVQATPADLPTSLNLPIQDAPPRFESDNPADWANCTAYGVIPGATTEQGNAMIAALNSGKPIVYCPDNAYRFGKQMVIPATVKVLDMLGSGAKPTSGTNPSRLLRVETSSPDPLYIRRFAYSGSGLHQILYVSAQRLVVLEDVSAGRSSQIFVEPGAGPVIIKGGMTSQIQVGAGASVFADMLNLEGLSATGAPQYLNAGKLWALSAKYETPIARGRTLPGGCTEILGGLDYPVGAVPAGTLEHEVQEGGQAFLVYAESAYQAANEFPIALRLTRGGVVTDVLGPSLPARGAGRFAVLSAHTGACGQ